ncbi:MAG: hydantoinase/oxoprolinase family protein [Archaeoglobaceae archaeon]
MKALGLDIGGANLKLSCEDHSEITYFPLWNRYSELEQKLKDINTKFHPQKVGVVVTAELADCFNSRAEGIKTIFGAVRNAFPCEVLFLDIKGDLQLFEGISNPHMFFASNWVATANFLLSEGWQDFILADMGSTTTDLIPVTHGIMAKRADHDRLKRGELFYCGVLRTPVFHTLPQFDVPLIPEYFAINGDAFVVTGDLAPHDYTCDTPDDRGKSREECMSRLARTVSLDVEGNEEYIGDLALAVKEEVINKTGQMMEKVASENMLNRVLGCGVGEFILHKAALKAGLEYLPLKNYYPCTDLFPAYAVSRLVANERGE